MRKIIFAVLMGALATGGAADVSAQEGGVRTATARVGGLMYDRGGDATNLMVGVGVNWTLSRHLLAEVEGTWSSAETTVLSYANSPSSPLPVQTTSHLATATAGIQAQAIVGRFRPYFGMATGLFVRYDEHDGGDRFPRYTVAFPAGLRVDLTQRVALRGELRARFDTHQDGGGGTNVEQSVGLSFRF
jgi:Outer membrane protein beta-barrel domain